MSSNNNKETILLAVGCGASMNQGIYNKTIDEMQPHILVVDDDDRLRTLLRRYLMEQGFLVTTAAQGEAARACLKNLAFDVAIFDVMMPHETGIELAKALRKGDVAVDSDLPILFLTARAEAENRIEGLEVGGDDYLTKPFEPRELLLRLQAIIRRRPRKKKEDGAILKLGRWVYDASRDELSDGLAILRLTDMEAGLLRLLAAEPGKTVSRELIAERSRGAISERSVDVQITRLRRRFEVDPKNPRYLLTVRGEGYMLLPDRAGG